MRGRLENGEDDEDEGVGCKVWGRVKGKGRHMRGEVRREKSRGRARRGLGFLDANCKAQKRRRLLRPTEAPIAGVPLLSANLKASNNVNSFVSVISQHLMVLRDQFQLTL